MRPGDSGSPTFIYNPTTGKYEYIAAQQSAGAEAYGQARGNVEWTQETLNKFDVNIDMSEASTIHLGAVNKAGETITETLGDKAYSTTLYSGLATDANGKEVGEYIGVQTGINTWTNLNDRKNLNNWYAYENKDYTWDSPTYGQVISDLNVADADLFYTQNLVFTSSQLTNSIILDATVDLGIGYAEFNKGENMEDKAVFNITAGPAGTMFNHAGYVINEGAEVHLKLTNPETHMTEWRKTGAGDLYIDGTGNTNALLNVGGSGKTYLNQTGGHAAYNVLVNSGATVVINGINQIERDLTFGAGGGTLDMNGKSMDWYASGGESREGFTIQALTEEAMITNTSGQVILTYKQEGNTTYKGSFSDSATGSLSIVYDGGGTWTLNSIHTDLTTLGNSSFTVNSGKVILSGTNTVHGMGSATATNANRLQVENDWHYADAAMGVEIASGATFELGSHARLKGQVNLDNGATFIIREAVKHQYEYVEGGSSLEDTYQYSDYYGYKGVGGLFDIYLGGYDAALKIEYSEGTTANMTIDASIYGKGAVSVDTGLAGGTLTLAGDNKSLSGTKTLISGGLIAESANALGNTSTNKWKVQEKGWIASHHHTGAELLGNIDSSSTGVLALSSDTKEQLNLSGHKSLYVGAETGKTIEYGEKGTTTELTAQDGAWRLGGGGGILNVNFLLAGENNLIIGNTYSSGTVHLANTGNTFSGDIIIMGTGNLLTYADVSALGSARVALSYGNTLAMHQQSDLGLLKSGAQGVMAVVDSFDVDLTGYGVALGAVGDVTFTDALTVGDMYRLGGSGNLILDTALDSTKKILIDGQGNSGSAVTFAWENAYSGDIVAGGGMNLETPNSTGSVGIHAGHANTFAATNSVELQQGAALYTDGHANMVVQNLTAQTGAGIVNNGTTASSLELRVTQNASIADGVLNDANNSASLSLVKTGEGNLSMAGNKSWSGGLTIQEGQVTVNAGNGGVGSSANKIHIEDKGTLRVEAGKVDYGNIGQTIVNQTITGTGTIVAASGGNMLLTQQSAGFEGTVHVTEGTRLYVGKDLTYSRSSPNAYNNVQAFDDATIKVDSGSQVRITNNFVHVSQVAVVSHADYTIAGSGLEKATSSELIHEGLIQGALSIDCGATIMGNVTLDENATIASWSKNPTESLYRPTMQNIYGRYYSIINGAAELSGHYGIKGYLGGTIRGQILGEGKDLTIAGCESMTITADSANTFRNLNIANGNGNNTEKFALCLDGGKALSQTYTALGTGSVTLNEGLILRLAGTGMANQTDVVYTYENNIAAGNGATIQSYNITNKLTGTVTTTGNLNLATDHGGVLHLAGGFAIAESAQNTTQTLTIAAGSSIRIGSGEGDSFSGNVIAGAGVTLALDSNTALSAGSTISGTDSLTLCLGGANAYTLGGIELNNSESVAESNLTLRFDFTSAPNVGTEEAWCFLTSSITADSLIVGIDLNMFDNIGKGDYVLVNDIGNTHFELAEGSSSRFSLSKDGSNLVLTVAADDRLVWTTGSGTTQTWDTSSANWYSEAEDDMIAFSAGTDVLLTSKGVEENNSPNARETIALATDVTAGSIMVQDSCYEITGEHKLSGKSLRLGEGADLKLSTSQAEFTQGVQVNNALLTVAETQLDATILVENNASVTLSGAISTGNITVDSAELSASNSTITGDLLLKNASANIDSDSQIIGNVRLTESEVNISGSSTIHGSISVDTSSTLAMESTKLTGEISVGEGIFSTVNLKADNTKDSTYGQATLSGNIDARGGSSLSLIDGSVVLDGAISLDSLSIAGGKTVTIWNAAAASGADKNIKNVELGNGAILQTIDRDKTSAATSFGNLKLTGASATFRDQYHAGYYNVDSLSMSQDINTSVLNVVKISDSTLATVVNLGKGDSVAGNFKGQINLSSKTGEAGDDARSLFLILGGSQVAAGASVNLKEADSNTAVLGVGINTETATIAGLESNSGLSNRAKVFSGYVGTQVKWGKNDNAPDSVGTALRTLTIDTAAKGDYTFHGEVLSNLNLVKDGAGKQTFSGNSANFNGSIEILEGTLAFTGDALGMLGTASSVTVNGGTLDISSYDFNTGDSLSINNFSFSDTSVLALGNLQADTSYNFFNTALENWTSLGMENFSIGGTLLSSFEHATLSLGMDGSFSYSTGWNLVWNGGATGSWTTAAGNEQLWQTTDASADGSTTSTGFSNGDNVTFEASATVTLGSDIMVSTMNVNSGTVVVKDSGSYAFNADTVNVAANSHMQMWGDTENAGADNVLSKVVMAEGATLSTNNRAAVSAATTVDTLVLNGKTANLKDVYHSGYIKVNELRLGEGIASSKLVLTKTSDSANVSVFEFGSASTDAGNFIGTLELIGGAEINLSSGARSAGIIISHNTIAKNADISLSSNTSGHSDSYLTLGINAANATIAGLASGSSLGNHAVLYSGAVMSNEAWGESKIDNGSTRTLTIETEKGTEYTFYGKVVNTDSSKLNLVKSGEGTQRFLGSGSFGSITVNEGTLTLGGSMTVTASGTITVEENALLQVSSTSTFGNTGNVKLNKTGSGTMIVNSKISQNWLDILTGTFEVGYTGADGNNITNIDAGIDGTATGQVLVKKGAQLTSTTIWMKKGTIALEEGGMLNYKGATIIGEAASSTAIIERTNKNDGGEYTGLTDSKITISGARVKSTVAGATISNKLTNSSVENAGGGVLTVTNEANTLSGVVASKGDVTLQKLAAATSLNLLEIAAGRTVNAYVGTNVNEKQTVTVSGTALLSGTSTLNTSLTLNAGATLDMVDMSAGAAIVAGALTFDGQLTMGDKLLAILDEMSSWENHELTLITGLDSFTFDGVEVVDGSMLQASTYFSNVSDTISVSYRVSGDVGSLVLVSMDVVPEPTTSTLSLLALAGLCARRRRKD